MTHSSDNSSAKKLTHPVAITLSKRQGEIIETWVSQVQAQVHSAQDLQRPIIVDTIPVFLGNLAEALDSNLSRNTANDSNNVAEEHGGERARVTDYGPGQVVLEYILLRDITLSVLTSEHQLEKETFSIFQKSFDEAIQNAMMAFHLVFNEIRENVVTHLTHDIRTPLTSAKLSLDLILKIMAKPASEESKERIISLVNRTKKNIDYSNELIQNILDERSIKSYQSVAGPKLIPAEMLTIVKSAQEDLSVEIKKRIVVSGEAVEGYWDSKAIRRLVENLISNAIKYGDEVKDIQIKVASSHGRVLLSVHNEGNPIPVEDRELMFKNFQRLIDARKGTHEGWGLGLAYCREVTEQHAGSLGVESSVENGTTFTIDIPVDPRGIKIKTTIQGAASQG